MYHEWVCPDCGHELHHECEITEHDDPCGEAAEQVKSALPDHSPQGDSDYCGDPDDPNCGPDLGKPWCAYHGGTKANPYGNSGVWRINPDDGPSFIARQSAEHDIFRVIADRLEQQRVLEENERADKRLRKAQNPKCERECTEHPAHLWDGTPVPQGDSGGVPCNCQGLSHSNDCPNWELPH